MEDSTNNSSSHALDGCDADDPTARPVLTKEGWQWACNAREDWKELKTMAPEEISRYCGSERQK